MGQALPVKAHPEAAAEHQPLMVGYGFEMLPDFHQAAPFPCSYIIVAFLSECKENIAGKLPRNQHLTQLFSRHGTHFSHFVEETKIPFFRFLGNR